MLVITSFRGHDGIVTQTSPNGVSLSGKVFFMIESHLKSYHVFCEMVKMKETSSILGVPKGMYNIV